MHRRALELICIGPLAVLLAQPAPAGERELDQDTAPASASEIASSIQRVFPEEEDRPSLFPWVRRWARQKLGGLPPFFTDTRIEARFRTYWLRADRASEPLVGDRLSQAWAIGGSLSYRSGWLADLFQAEVEGFTSLPLVAPDDQDGTLLLAPGQDGFGVLGIANGKLRYKGIMLTGGRMYLDLPYVNRQDNRMVPNTFEALTLEKPEGTWKFSTGYSWRIKRRDSDEFETFTETLGLRQDRGLIHGGIVWDPSKDLHLGAILEFVPDLLGTAYTELSLARENREGFEFRVDAQFTYQAAVGDDLLSELIDSTWNLGFRGSISRSGAVLRLGGSFTGENGGIFTIYGTDPSYVDLMQRTFNSADEKVLLASISYDFDHVGVEGLSGIVNFVASFDADVPGLRGNAREVDVTFDYRPQRDRKSWLSGLWLRVRGSWLADDETGRDGTDFRVFLFYDIPVI